MYLSDEQIRFALTHDQFRIDPYVPENVQPVSIDLTLGSRFLTPVVGEVYETHDANTWIRSRYSTWPNLVHYRLEPGDFVLGTTRETVQFRSYARGEHKERYDLFGHVHGKSTLGRLGLLVHVTAGLIDPGFSGKITLELKNIGCNPIVLHVGTKICQLTLTRCGVVSDPYPRDTSKYNGQVDTTWAR